MTSDRRTPGRSSSPLGRKRDPALDAHILNATLDTLADAGAAALTMDLVATRAGTGKATIYRRWASKTELMRDAVAHFKQVQIDLNDLPDTGSLRDDLLGLFRPQSAEETERRLRLVTGLASLLAHDADFAQDIDAAVVQPWAQAHLTLMQRAAQRGEISASADLSSLSHVVAAMAAYRSLIQRQPFTLGFLEALVDGVLLPALRGSPNFHRSSS